jgi:hypothetical protein
MVEGAMKTAFGLLLGIVGYGAWKISEPSAGESADIGARLARLKVEWLKATDQGRLAGQAKRLQLESEFDAIFKT